MWTVASTTRSTSAWNIIATRVAPVRCASSSVWPRHGIARRGERFLVDRRGRDRRDAAVAARRRRPRGSRRRRPGPLAPRRGRSANDSSPRRPVEHRLADLQHARIRCRLARDLRADAGRIADGDADLAGLDRVPSVADGRRGCRSSVIDAQLPQSAAAARSAAAAGAGRVVGSCRSRPRRRSRRASRPCRSAARSAGST